MSSQKFYVITFDIPDNKRRTKLGNILLGFGERVQRSVFECVLSESQFMALRQQMDKWVKPEEDSVRYYNLGAQSVADVEVQGSGKPTSVPTVYVV
ncbi:MAG: CRISPR-associated endonuclease Cas2 [Anaerolineae bacterium]|nr:CRISPR-associated endonuclease Cas2 [Anaerolineae bacterium]